MQDAARKRRREYQRAWQRKLKAEAIAAYGGYCRRCGESRLDLLVLDHINDNGAEHRRETGTKGGWPFYQKMRQQGWPVGLQVLCHNCNAAKQRGLVLRQPRLLHLTKRAYGYEEID